MLKDNFQNFNRQMHHASSEQLHRLLKNASCNDSELIKLVDVLKTVNSAENIRNHS